jgi:hypothetical protein
MVFGPKSRPLGLGLLSPPPLVSQRRQTCLGVTHSYLFTGNSSICLIVPTSNLFTCLPFKMFKYFSYPWIQKYLSTNVKKTYLRRSSSCLFTSSSLVRTWWPRNSSSLAMVPSRISSVWTVTPLATGSCHNMLIEQMTRQGIGCKKQRLDRRIGRCY